MHKFILSLGSNCHSHKSMEKTKELLIENTECIDFTSVVKTKPYNMIANLFLNCLAWGTTQLNYAHFLDMTKNIETICGNSKQLRQEGKVVMDIDILMFDNKRYHEHDWSREYIVEGIKECKYEID